MKGRVRATQVLAVIFFALAFSACGGSMSIQRLQSRPQQYEGKDVKIAARVVDTRDVPLTDNDYYKITDDTGTIWVLTRRGVPLRTLKYRIEGVYRRPTGPVAGLVLGDYVIEEFRRTEIDTSPQE